MLKVTGSISANTGFAPHARIAVADAIKLKGVVITSSPGLIPAASNASCKALVPLVVATAYSEPV